MASSNTPRPGPHGAQPGCESADGQEDDEETSWLLAAALIEIRRQGAPCPRDEVLGTLAEMTAEHGAGTITRAAAGLADIAAVLLEVCADSLMEPPRTVLRDVLASLRDHG
jgi:hypothetical protein